MRNRTMKILTLALAISVVACVGKKESDDAQYSVGMPPAAEASHVIAQKIAPDTLVDQSGRFCIVRPAPKWAGTDSGSVYENCAWSDTARRTP
jgi:hypothetical protein